MQGMAKNTQIFDYQCESCRKRIRKLLTFSGHTLCCNQLRFSYRFLTLLHSKRQKLVLSAIGLNVYVFPFSIEIIRF